MKGLVAAVALAGCGRFSFDATPDSAVDATVVDVDFGDARIPSGVTFTWIGGGNIVDQVGIYGVLTLPDAANMPGARDNGAAWVGANGDLYLLGGHAYGASGTEGKSNDLWQYRIATNQWAWIHGNTDPEQGGTYGTQTVSAASNVPGARNDTAMWRDGNYLYTFAGHGFDSTTTYGSLDDVWRWDILLKQWAWMNGTMFRDQFGVYTGSTPRPGARGAPFAWQTTTHAYVYGGDGFGSIPAISGKLADLWRYSFTDNDWELVAGNGSLNAVPSYGTLGVPAMTNTPGARDGGCAWSDGAGGAWIYGGAQAGVTFSDMWRYTNNTWTWIHGSQTLDVAPTYGTLGVPAATNSPGARENANCWQDGDGNLWLYGGIAIDDPLADLWVYSPIASVWTWVGGVTAEAAPGVYGLLGVTDAANRPGARSQGATWIDPVDGSFLLFGGDYGIDGNGALGSLNDLWRIVPE